MKSIITLLFIFLISGISGFSQLDSDYNSDMFSAGVNISLTTIENASMSSLDPLRIYKPYYGIGVDVMYHSYEKGKMRYFFTMKAITTDLLNVIFRNNADYGNHVDLSGVFWGKLGLNIYSNDNFCVGVGGSLADYIVDLPKWKPYYNENVDNFRYEEPSGWHFSAGPTIFMDVGIGDFILNSISAYNFGFYHNLINDDYERSIDFIEDYKTPHFFSTAAYLKHAGTGIYLSYEHTKMIDHGIVKNKLSRNEMALGWVLSF